MPKTRADLYDYQLTGAKFLASRRRAALYDDMGVGKTIQAIAAARFLINKEGPLRILVVAPASVTLNWHKEWSIWGDKDSVFRTVSYHMMGKVKRVNHLWDIVIADESHHLKAWESAWTRNFVNLFAPKCKRFWFLTGTPATRSASDYHPQLSMLEPGVHGTYESWCDRYCLKKTVGFGKYAREVVYGFQNTEEINAIVKRVSLRRTLEEVNKDLPPKRFTKLYLDVDYDREDFNTPLIKQAIKLGLAGGMMPESIVPPLRQLGLDKVDAGADYLLSINHPAVVFCWFLETVEKVRALLAKEKRVVAITGKTPQVSRQLYIEMLNTGKLDIIVANIAAAGTGNNMQGASLCVFMEYPWSPALYSQAWHRLFRTKQTKSVQIMNLLASGTIEDRVLKVMREKKKGILECLK